MNRSRDDVCGDDLRLRTEQGRDVTPEFERGAQAALELCGERGIEHAFLKENSPSCGVHFTYVDSVKVKDRGLTAARLSAEGFELHAVQSSKR